MQLPNCMKGQRLKVCEAKCTPQDWLVLIICLFDGGSACTMAWIHHSPDWRKISGYFWLPGPEDWRKLEGSGPDCAIQNNSFAKRPILVLSGKISFKFPANFWTSKPLIEPTLSLSDSVLHGFVCLSVPWCSQTINTSDTKWIRTEGLIISNFEFIWELLVKWNTLTVMVVFSTFY